MPARKLDFYLNSSDTLRKLSRAARRLDDLQRTLADNAPPQLTKFCCVKHLRNGVLTLAATNAAVATQLRHHSVRLLGSFQKQEAQVTSMRIEVQVGNLPSALAAERKNKALSIDTIGKIRSLADQLEDSPLKDALTRLASRPAPKS